MELVRTKSNLNLPKKDCKKISGDYYKIGKIDQEGSGECYEIDGKYYRIDTGYIIFNHEINKYEIKNLEVHHINQVINIEYDGTLVFGNFYKKNNLDEIKLITENGYTYFIIDESIINNTNKYILNLKNDRYYHYSRIKITDTLPEQINLDYKYSLNYSSNSSLIRKYSKYYHENNLKNEENLNFIKNTIKDLSFGVEIETTQGILNSNNCLKYGLMPLRDGSISGIEYATVPMSGVKGLSYLIEGFDILNKKTKINDSCSIHLHIGNIPRTESFILATFKLLTILQDELYGYFPLYIKEGLGVKRKHYTKPLPSKLLMKLDSNITKDNMLNNFNTLFYYLSGGVPYRNYDNDLKNVLNHPSDPTNDRKWQIRSRYLWCNIIPLIFGNKETIEFRLHTPTLDSNKILYFICLMSKIINFIKDKETYILNDKNIYDIEIKDIFTMFNMDNIDHSTLNYFKNRQNISYANKKQGNINYKENDVNCNKYFTNKYYSKKVAKTPLTSFGSIDTSTLDRLYQEARERVNEQTNTGRNRGFVSSTRGLTSEDSNEIENNDFL